VLITFSLKIDVDYRNYYGFMLSLFSYLTTKITVNITACFCFPVSMVIAGEKLFIETISIAFIY